MLRQLGADLGFVPLVMGASGTIFVLTLLASGNQIDVIGGGMNILSPSNRALLLFGMTGAVPVYGYGWWWTLFSASWLHGGLIHIAFNMMFIRQMGPATAEIIGPSRTVIVYVVAGFAGFLLSSTAGFLLSWIPIPILRGAYFTMGASASAFGLLGALMHYGRVSGSSHIRAAATQYAVGAAVFGLIMPGIDNYAHLGGFLGGYLVSAFMNPLTRERGDHLLAALGCLLVSFLAVAFSVFHGLSLLR